MVQLLLSQELHFLNSAAVLYTLLATRALQTMRITTNLHPNLLKVTSFAAIAEECSSRAPPSQNSPETLSAMQQCTLGAMSPMWLSAPLALLIVTGGPTSTKPMRDINHRSLIKTPLYSNSSLGR